MMFDLVFIALLFLPFIEALPLNSPLLPSYDYIVVGGGPAGLTIANRLSEDSAVNVLLLEAGPAGDDSPEIIIPGLIGDNIGGIYDWNLSTVPQIYLDGLPRSIPQGRVLSGGTILNGMLWNRGGQGDYADWEALGNDGWSWDDLLPYFIKSETYTPVSSEEIAQAFSIEDFAPAHGYSGPVNVSYPEFFWNSSSVLFSAINELGIPTAYDPNTGWVAGASFLPFDLTPGTEERCDARAAYYDPYLARANLWVSTGQVATQILFEDRPVNANASASIPGDPSVGQGGSPGIPGGIFGGDTTVNVSSSAVGGAAAQTRRNALHQLWERIKSKLRKRQTSNNPTGGNMPSLVAVGVEFAPDAQSTRQTVSATREVIVAAGALHSPQILMLSGIGPAAALEALSIPVNVDLPGVGSNLQDHGRVWCWYPYNNATFTNPTELTNNETFASEALLEYWMNRTGPLTAPAIGGVAFPPLPLIVNGSNDIANAAAIQSPNQYLPTNVDTTVLNGYAEQHVLMVSALQNMTRAAYEIINANDGVLTVATMRPFSRGTVTLNSPEPFDPPVIDPRYGSNPVDIQVLEAALAFNQRLLYTQSLSELDPIQIFPPADAQGAEIVQYIDAKFETEYHPSGTCAMMPIELGGVVSPELLVYGTQNLRVVDSSIMPMLPAAHLQAVVYGVAEKAAGIIKAAYADNVQNGASSSQPTTSSTLAATSIDAPSSQITAGLSTSSSYPQEPVSTSNGPVTSISFVTIVYTQTVYES